MADIQTYLNQILQAVWGKDVRQAIHDAIHQCYEDGKAGSIDLTDYQTKIDETLTTNNKEIVGAINENKESISQLSNEIADQSSQIDEAVANYLSENPVSGDLTTTAKNLLIIILRNGLYSTDQSLNITALETALGQSSTDTETVYYTITNTLTNVTNENANTQVLGNSSYVATLTANSGYAIDSVTVTMGGVDITSSNYADGVINISNVSGNIEIIASAIEQVSEATLPTDGLLGYWDFRNPIEVVTQDWHWAYPPNKGASELHFGVVGGSKGSVTLPTFDSNYGCSGLVGWVIPNYTSYPGDSKANDFGTEFTWCFMSYNGLNASNDYFNLSTISSSNYGARPTYNNTSSTTRLTQEHLTGSTAVGYKTAFVVVNGDNLKIYFENELFKEYNGANYSDFVSWYSLLKMNGISSNVDDNAIALACYDKALSEIELTEMQAFFKTLEVSA